MKHETKSEVDLEAKRMQLVERIAAEKGDLEELTATDVRYKKLKISIGVLEHELAELENNLGYGHHKEVA